MRAFWKKLRLTLAGALGLLVITSAAAAAPPAQATASAAPAKAAQAAAAHAPAATPAPAPAKPLRELPVGSFVAAALWLIAILALGLVTLPIVWSLFPYLEDRGAGFAKIFGLVVATFVSVVLVRLRLLPQGSGAAWAAFAAMIAASLFCLALRGRAMRQFWRERRRTILASEAVFLLGFFVFLLLRSFQPEIFWGEKPMDFSILNILVRTRRLPSSDPWFAGAPLGYYVFGQEMVAFLTLLTSLSTRFTFNLAFGLLGGTIAQGAFTLAKDWGGRLRAGFAGAAFTLAFGNLSGLREWIVTQHGRGETRHLDWHYFWATSRVIPETINEYPLWSMVFADLHAHLLSIPLAILFFACALQFVRVHADPWGTPRRRTISGLVLGFAAAVQALTNAWDVPLLLGLLVLLWLIASLSAPTRNIQAFVRAFASTLVAAGAFFVFLRPLWVRGGGAPGFGWNVEHGGRGIDVLTHFGLFFFLALMGWAVSAADQLAGEDRPSLLRRLAYPVAILAIAAGFYKADLLCIIGIVLFLAAIFQMADRPEERLAFGWLATGFFLVLLPQRAYIYDRMNTFFKLYVEAWPIFAIATAVLVFGASSRRGTYERWPTALRGIFVVLAAACLFTAATAVRGGIFGPNNPARPQGGGPGMPSLDGLSYLEKIRPGEYKAVLWMRKNLAGTPVVLEAQGNSYGDFSRVSMLTGFPTVLGWEHHVKQRGNPESEVDARRAAVKQIYTNPDAESIAPLLRKYHVGYVYVGWLERQTYGGPGLRKFESTPSLFRVVYGNAEAEIYQVVGGNAQDVITAPVREKIAAPAAAPSTGDEPEEKPSIQEKPAASVAPWSGMREPRGAAVDGQGRVWVMDFGNNRLRVFDTHGGFLGGWGGRGNGTYGLKEPCGVAIHGDTVYVADTWNGRVQSFTTAGEWKAAGRDLFGPRGITAAPDGTIWVTDTGNKRLVAYDGDLKLSRTIGKLGSGKLEFSDPVGIAAGKDGSLYVADAGNHRVQVIGPDGQFVREFPVADWKMGVEPHIEADEDGTLYVTNPPKNVLLEFDPSGTLRRTHAVDGSGAPLSRPTGVALDRKERLLYVINSGNNTVARIPLKGAK